MLSHKLLLACVFAAILAIVRSADPTEVLPGVHDLSPANFDSKIDGTKAALVEFYAPWCGHCKSMVPELKKLGELISKDPTLNSQVVIAKVNADEHSSLGQRFGIEGFPTLKWMPRGRTNNPLDYNGARDAENFIKFIRAQLQKDDSFGQIPELSVIAYKFVDGDTVDAGLIAEAKATAAKVHESQKANADQYIKYMEKIAAKGKGYVDTEAARLQKLAAGGASSAKIAEFNRKLSILMTFKGVSKGPEVADVEPEKEEEEAPVEEKEEVAVPEDGASGEEEEGKPGEPQDVEFLGYDDDGNMIVDINRNEPHKREQIRYASAIFLLVYNMNLDNMDTNSDKKLTMSEDHEVAKRIGLQIDFNNVLFSVPKKEILKGISGSCKPGRLMAIMGSSGAGKTTLLDILACNTIPNGKVEGTILVNGAPRRPTSFRRESCYVLQRDVLLSSATCRESIMTSALLKLPMTLTYEQKIMRVDNAIEELGLTECQNTLIGDDLLGIKGVSGGQRRRVSIGIELVKDPSVLFLDEPTSGLDSEMAFSLMEMLVQLARLGRTVVVTIHQPNSLITSKFDDFMLLASGKLVYGGPWSQTVDFFAAAGLKCPQYTNPTDYFLRELQNQEVIDTLADRQRARCASASGDIGDTDVESGATAADATIQMAPHAPSPLPSAPSSSAQKIAPSAPGWYQTYILTARNYRMYLRNPLMLFSETAQYAFMALFIGLMYLRLNNSIETGVSDRLASIWFGMAVLSFTPSYTAVTIWDRDRVLLRREMGQSMYSASAWFVARTFVSVPMQILQTLLFGIITFFMVGYAFTASTFLIYLASYALFQITSESVGVLSAAVTKTSTTAVLVLTFVLLILLSFSGFLVSYVPVYFRWVRIISFLTYAYNAIVISVFDQTYFVCETGLPACAQKGLVVPGSDLIPKNNQNGLGSGENLLVLLGITVGTRILCFLTILGAYHFHYL